MAIENAKRLSVRIKNKYDSYENWASSGLILEPGEIAIAYTTVDVKVDNGTAKHPALLMKVGDGEKTFANLPWLSAKAADVLSVCKNETELTTFVNNVIANAGIATDAAMKALTGRVATAEGAIDALEVLVGSTSVQAQISSAIAALNLASTYEKAGVAKGLVDALADGAVQDNADAIAAINHAETGILAQAKAYANGLDSAMNTRVAGLEAKFGDGEDTVEKQISDAVNTEKERAMGVEGGLNTRLATVEADYLKAADIANMATDAEVAAAVKAEADRAKGIENGLETRLAAVEDDYLKAADKTELSGAIALKANQTALDDVSAVANAAVKQSDYDTKVAALEAEDARIAGLVEAEATKARAEEGKLDARLVEVEAFFKLAEGENLDTALDTLVEIQEYITGEGAAADQMVLDIAANKKAIEDHVATNHDFASADAALKSELEGKINAKADASTVTGLETALDTRLKTLEAINHEAYKTADATLKTELEGKIALKADASAVTAMDTAYKAADTAIKGRLDVLEAIEHDAYKAADTALENKLNAEITKKADKTVVEGIDGRLTTAETKLTGIEAGAEVNIIEAVKVNGTALLVSDKSVNITVPTGALADKDKVAEADLATDLASKINDKADKSALETAKTDLTTEINKKANDADLASIAKSGSTDDLIQGLMTLVLDCGGASEEVSSASYSLRAKTPSVSSGSDGVFESDGIGSNVTSVEINGQVVDPSYYTIQ